jgi:O-antigen ligase
MVAGLPILVGVSAGSGNPWGVVGASVLAGITTALAIAARFGARRLVVLVGMAAAAMTPWVGVRAGSEITAGDVVFVVAIALVLVYRLAHPWLGPQSSAPALGGIALITVAGLVSTFFAPDPVISIGQLTRFSASTVSILAFFALLAPSRREVLLLSLAFVAGTLVSAVIGVLFVDEIYGRAVGLSLHSNHLGLVVFMAIGILLGASGGGDRRIAMVGLAILMFAAVVTGSRASMGGVILTGALYLWATRRVVLLRRVVVVIVGVLVAMSLGWISVPTTNGVGRLLGDETVAGSNAKRVDEVATSLEQIWEHPVTGSGFGAALEAHNIYLQLWQAGGVLALGGVAVNWALAIGALRQGRRQQDGLLIGLASAYVAYLVMGLVGNQLWDRYIWVIFALMIAARRGLDTDTSPTGGGVDEVPAPIS